MKTEAIIGLSQLKNHGVRLWNQLSAFELAALGLMTFLTLGSAACFYFVGSYVRGMQENLAKAEIQLAAMESALTHRFAYITADFDAAKSQIRELDKSVNRLSANGLKLINYLENRDKNASVKRR
jgi:hypothetical protein